MGFAMAIHRVTIVITARNATVSLEITLRWMANSIMMPKLNSNADKATDRQRINTSGMNSPIPNADR